jgi:CheY-like chemotaxis protein
MGCCRCRPLADTTFACAPAARPQKQECLKPSAWLLDLFGFSESRHHEWVDGVAMKVLIADDCADTAESLSELLQFYGHEVRCAGDGFEAVAAAREFQPSAAIIDIGMPRVDGYQVALELRAMLPGIALIAATGWPKSAARDQEQRRFDHYLIKPIPIEHLLAVLDGSGVGEASSSRQVPRSFGKERPSTPTPLHQECQSQPSHPSGAVALRRRHSRSNA